MYLQVWVNVVQKMSEGLFLLRIVSFKQFSSDFPNGNIFIEIPRQTKTIPARFGPIGNVFIFNSGIQKISRGT
jgi:hypothetical protein